MSDAAISVRGLRRSYGDHPAVDGIDLDVTYGEVFALLGPNGAGKTTTVEILEGYRRRDGGAISVLGVDPRTADATWRARIGIVLQSTGEFEELTVAEVVHHFAAYYPRPDDPDEVIERVGLTAKRSVRAKTLSGGQRRRLDVALSIIGRPELLFLDEPTTGFDPQARHDFWKVVRQLASAGTTILLTTHYLHEAEALADRVAVIHQGRILEVGTPDELGGRSGRRTMVRWRDGQLRTHTPTQAITELAARYGGEVPGLTVTRPTLEDIYLDLIGDREATEPAPDREDDPAPDPVVGQLRMAGTDTHAPGGPVPAQAAGTRESELVTEHSTSATKTADGEPDQEAR